MVVTSLFLPITDQWALVVELKVDPFLEHVLNTSTCQLYHKFGMCLAPATLTTIRHCCFGHLSKMETQLPLNKLPQPQKITKHFKDSHKMAAGDKEAAVR